MTDGILYVDVDDEITSAAARIRRSEGSRVVLVLPYGSKVATSRINFRLLARDALIHEKRLSIVAPDGATRALAASAGLPVFASVAEYEDRSRMGIKLTLGGRPPPPRLPERQVPNVPNVPKAPSPPRRTTRRRTRLPRTWSPPPNPTPPMRRS